jgi:uncharacterized phiE125 gp8 family phage protein
MMNSILTVVTPADTYDLTVLATVKSRLGITDDGEDATLSDFIVKQSRVAAKWCGRVFAREDLQEVFRRVARDSLTLARWPVTTISSIVADDVTLTADDWEMDAASGQVFRLSSNGDRRRWWARKITVLYTAGYALLEELPDDIEEAVILMIAGAYAERGKDPAVKSETVDGIGKTDFWVGDVPGEFVRGLPLAIASMLEPYINTVVG